MADDPLADGTSSFTPGRCPNCDDLLDPQTARRTIFCSNRCRQFAKSVRYFRAVLKDGRRRDPDVRDALRMRFAHMLGGGYDEAARRLPPAVRREVLDANGGLCCGCGLVPATEVDHIAGSSAGRGNLQGLCWACHIAKSRRALVPKRPEQEPIREEFLQRVRAAEPLRICDDPAWDDLWRQLGALNRQWVETADLPNETVAIAVVASRHGVLSGRRRDGTPPWTLPGGEIRAGETPADTAVREVAEECGLAVRAGVELGRRIHPLTGRTLVYLACEPLDDTEPRVSSPQELVQVCWLDADEIEQWMPDLYGPVQEFLDTRAEPRTGGNRD